MTEMNFIKKEIYTDLYLMKISALLYYCYDLYTLILQKYCLISYNY